MESPPYVCVYHSSADAATARLGWLVRAPDASEEPCWPTCAHNVLCNAEDAPASAACGAAVDVRLDAIERHREESAAAASDAACGLGCEKGGRTGHRVGTK